MTSSQVPKTPYQPYGLNGSVDAHPTALQILKDNDAFGKLKGRTILITGCSSGIGVETARALYETGATLFLTARDVPKLHKVIEEIVAKSEHNKDGPKPVAVEMHLDSLESVRKGAEAFKKQANGQLNILINNAGVMACPLEKTVDGFERQIGTNHMAHFLLFSLLKPLLLDSAKKSGVPSRVINVASSGHRFGGIRFDDINFEKHPEQYHKWLSYGQSKSANIYMASSITRHYGAQNLLGLSVHPGAIVTELGRHLTPEDYAMFGEMKLVFKSTEQGAATTVWAAVSPHFDVKNSGRYLEDVGEAGPLAEGTGVTQLGYSPHIYDEEAEEKLWRVSCKAVGVPED